MTAAIKAMLAEREAVAAAKRRQPPSRLDQAEDALFSIIDRAAVFIDEGSPATEFRPSTKLKVAYYVFATSDHPEGHTRGAKFVESMLERARRRYLRGLHPNPWQKVERCGAR